MVIVKGLCGLLAGGAETDTSFDDAEYVPVPSPLMAATAKRYELPLMRPVTVHCVAVLVCDEGQAFITLNCVAVLSLRTR